MTNRECDCVVNGVIVCVCCVCVRVSQAFGGMQHALESGGDCVNSGV